MSVPESAPRSVPTHYTYPLRFPLQRSVRRRYGIIGRNERWSVATPTTLHIVPYAYEGRVMPGSSVAFTLA